MSLCTLSIVHTIFSFWFFEINEGILRNWKIIVGSNSFSNLRLINLTPVCIDSLVESCKITVILVGSMLPNL